VILYIGNHKDSIKSLIALIHEFSKVAGYKKSVTFLFTNSIQSEKELKKTTPFIVASKIT
jgi:hypothetical protein